jgi:hypothetical protein
MADDQKATQAQALDEVHAWLAGLNPVTRARYLAVLLDGANMKRLAAMRVEAVYEVTRDLSYAEASRRLGVSVNVLNHAVTKHRATLRAAGG